MEADFVDTNLRNLELDELLVIATLISADGELEFTFNPIEGGHGRLLCSVAGYFSEKHPLLKQFGSSIEKALVLYITAATQCYNLSVPSAIYYEHVGNLEQALRIRGIGFSFAGITAGIINQVNNDQDN